MIEKHSYDNILQTMRSTFEEKSGAKVEDFGDIDLRMQVLAGEIYSLEKTTQWLYRQMFMNTATGNELDKHAEMRGIFRKEAAYAKGELTFSLSEPATTDIDIPKGTLCSSKTGETSYETIQSAVIKIGKVSATVEATAVYPGEESNCAVGRVCVMVTPPKGVDTVTNLIPFTGGCMAENDEMLRQRLIQTFSERSNGLNCAFYRDYVLSYEDVLKATVIPNARGRETFDIYIVLKDGVIDDTLLERINTDLKRDVQIGTDFEVRYAKGIAYTSDIALEVDCMQKFDDIKKACNDKLSAYIKGLNIGEPILLSQLGHLIMTVDGVKNYTFIYPTQDTRIFANEYCKEIKLSFSGGV